MAFLATTNFHLPYFFPVLKDDNCLKLKSALNKPVLSLRNPRSLNLIHLNILTTNIFSMGQVLAVAGFLNNDGLQEFLFFTGNQVSNKSLPEPRRFQNSKEYSSKAWCGSLWQLVVLNTCRLISMADGWMDIYVATAMLKGSGQRNNPTFCKIKGRMKKEM